jgi:methyl-accepting chemotaxis protein
MNPLSLPAAIAVRVLGDLTAIATAARTAVPVAQAIGELDLRQMQDDLHTLAQTASALPRIEQDLTHRMDEAEDTIQRGVEAAQALVEALPEITGGIDEVRRAREAAQALVDAVPVIAGGIEEIRRARVAAAEIVDGLPVLGRAADAAEKLVGGIDEVRQSREVLIQSRETLERASKNIEEALQRIEPLQGLTERIGRISDRLPGGTRDPR